MQSKERPDHRAPWDKADMCGRHGSHRRTPDNGSRLRLSLSLP